MSLDISHGDGVLEVFDKIERRSVRLAVDGWEPRDEDYKFRFPVDNTFAGKCRALSYDGSFLTFVRRVSDYEIIAELQRFREFVLPRDEYVIDIDAHVKVYIHLFSSIRASRTDDERIKMIFDEDAVLILGVRSYHRRPASVIYTTQRFADLARSISLLSSSIKVDSCERSYPTLRGHPPLIEFADEFSADLEKKDSGVEISIPRKLPYLYVVAPLAYYLLAEIRFGDPKIITDGGYEYDFPRMPKFEDVANTLMQKIFFLDCLVRNAGLYKLNIYELRALDGLGVDIDELYEMRIGEQLATYLSISTEKLKPYMPTWHISSYVEPRIEKVKIIPFLLNDMAAIYTPRSRRLSPRDVSGLAVCDLFRGNVLEEIEEKNIAKPLLKKAQSHLWLAPEKPIGVAKIGEESFFNQFRYYSGKSGVEIALILNDEKMLDEKEMVGEIYAKRKNVALKTTVFDFLGRDELAEVIGRGFDLVHFIGHCEEDGLVCSDGFLSARDIVPNNTPVFFLNACKSYEEGMELVRGGSVGGVVTLYYIPNDEALRVSYNFSRLFSLGFPIGKAMELARMGTVSGRDYLILGNGGYSIVQGEANIAMIYEIVKVDGADFYLNLKSSWAANMGGYVHFNCEKSPYHCLLFNEHPVKLNRLELMKFLKQTRDPVPVIYDKKLFWSHEFSVGES